MKSAGSLEFDLFWLAFPRKRQKKDAQKAWNAAMKAGVTADGIMATLSEMFAGEWRGRDLKYVPYPATFIRAEAFDDAEAACDDREPLPLFRKIIQHWCTFCEEGHWANCTSDGRCEHGFEREQPCAVYLVAYMARQRGEG